MARLLRVVISYPDHPVFTKTQEFLSRLFARSKAEENISAKHKKDDTNRSVWIAGADNEMASWVQNINNN